MDVKEASDLTEALWARKRSGWRGAVAGERRSAEQEVATVGRLKGSIKGGVVGGVAGHMAGHGKLGAAAGCATGHHEANKAEANNNSAQPPSDHK